MIRIDDNKIICEPFELQLRTHLNSMVVMTKTYCSKKWQMMPNNNYYSNQELFLTNSNQKTLIHLQNAGNHFSLN